MLLSSRRKPPPPFLEEEGGGGGGDVERDERRADGSPRYFQDIFPPFYSNSRRNLNFFLFFFLISNHPARRWEFLEDFSEIFAK